MRFLLLLSALLSAMVGSGAVARPALAQTHQAVGLVGVLAPKAAEAAQARRPVTGLPRIVDAAEAGVTVATRTVVAISPTDAPIYAMRLRV
ncbi:hypothetical protein D3Y57_05670 [Sphingomonas paeninsulae]|uniref:Uncharacterized protein n=1 Tax=Sphingomonas paeninsulae TaxID=2319844 RepID=A0A494TIG2_SPHPE|nr:hypothetical protein [Sphingomonas paeninsulae]AYJ85561.1 hypothetical protein D3Y57_05670 [Sphingomonas paeninsulae]